MKKIYTLFCVAAVMLAAMSCTREYPATGKDAGKETIDLSVTGYLGEYQSEDTKSSLVNNIRVAWADGDEVLVFDRDNVKYLGALTATVSETDNRTAHLSGAITAPEGTTLAFFHGTGLSSSDFIQGAIYTSISVRLASQETGTPFFVFGEAGYTTTDISGLTVHFKFATSVISTYITGLPESTKISAAPISISSINTKCNISIYDMAIASSDNGTITVLTQSDASTNAKGQTFVEIAVPASPKSSGRTASIAVNGVTYQGDFSKVALEYGYSYNTIVEMEPVGPFPISVSATKAVYFSKGNLYFDGDAFNFEENQPDFSAKWSASHISHFYWSKTAGAAYSQKYSDTLSDEDVLFTNGTVDTPNADFTVNKEKGTWRVLSGTEWNYIFNERANASDKWGAATINSTQGIVILPDTWAAPGRNYFKAGSDGGYKTNMYSSEQWAAMEAAGAIFLPCIGLRVGELDASGTEIKPDFNRYLASGIFSDPDIQGFVSELIIDGGTPGSDGGSPANGCAIRLVKDVTP